MTLIDSERIERLAKAVQTTGDLGGEGQAPLSVDQGGMPCPFCGTTTGKHKKSCKTFTYTKTVLDLPPTNVAPKATNRASGGLTKASDKGAEPFSSSKTSNWVARAGGLPHYIQHIAHDLVDKGMPESKAIAMAIGIVKNWAEGKGNVKPDTRAAAAKAVAQWESMKAKSHVTKASDSPAVVEEVLKSFNEALHPRVEAGKQGGGRFAPKGEGSQDKHAKPKQDKKLHATGRKEARRLAHALGQLLTHPDSAKNLLALRAKASHAAGGSTPANWGKRPTPAQYPVGKWNKLSDARRLKLMREFKAKGGKLPSGRKFAEDGSIISQESVKSSTPAK